MLTKREALKTLNALENASNISLKDVPDDNPDLLKVREYYTSGKMREKRHKEEIDKKITLSNVIDYIRRNNASIRETARYFEVCEKQITCLFTKYGLKVPKICSTELIKEDGDYFFTKRQLVADFLKCSLQDVKNAVIRKYNEVDGWSVYSVHVSTTNVPATNIVESSEDVLALRG